MTSSVQIFNDFVRMQRANSQPMSKQYHKSYAAMNDRSDHIQHKRHHKHHKNEKINWAVLIGSVVGTALPVAVMIKKQGLKLPADIKSQNMLQKAKSLYKTYNKIEFEAKELIAMSLGGLVGGSLCGGLTDKEKSPKHRKNRIKEFIFQALNVTIPTLITGALVNQVDRYSPKKYRTPLKIASTILGVGAGMPIAALTSNKINKTFVDKHDHGKKIHPKNYLVHSDDAVSALVLAKVPFMDKLPIKVILPAIFANCGYEAGTADK